MQSETERQKTSTQKGRFSKAQTHTVRQTVRQKGKQTQ